MVGGLKAQPVAPGVEIAHAVQRAHEALAREIAAGAPQRLHGHLGADERLERVLTCDPGMGVVRHADAGYDEAIRFARKAGVKIPMQK